ncbi:hypothetical protein C8255_05795 [filamentous cyanobacterium CCP3]|nr:hypothetical protein C8255_05795 [filamentous cyanobacterium CCP3]
MNDSLTQLRTLTEIIKDAVASKEEEDSKKLVYFIRRSLGQVGLSGQYEESEVLIQAYIRIRDKILSGVYIHNFLPYLSRVCYLIILEESRKRKSQIKLRQKLRCLDNIQAVSEQSSYSEAFSEELIDSLWDSFSALTESDKEILRLRIVSGLSWREIAIILVERGEEPSFHKGLEPKLRKQGERALVKLRNKLSSVDES